MIFRDRQEAGQQLAKRLLGRALESPVVIALPRGGVIVGSDVAHKLGASLSVILTRRISAPEHPEIGIGAVAEGGIRIIDRLAMRLLGLSNEQLGAAEEKAMVELRRRTTCGYNSEPLPSLCGRSVILVDDGLASGLTARAAIEFIRRQNPARLILAVPVTSPAAAAMMLSWADEVVCVAVPPNFLVVSEWYHEFDPAISDDAVAAAIDRTKQLEHLAKAGSRETFHTLRKVESSGAITLHVTVETAWGKFEGTFESPSEKAKGIVLFAHGAGSGRNSERNRSVAAAMRRDGFGTLQFDMLTPTERSAEETTLHLRFNLSLLIERVEMMLRWITEEPLTTQLLVVGFGSSMGAAALLGVAARNLNAFAAIVSRGGRVDCVEPLLAQVKTPTLLFAGSRDSQTLHQNKIAFERLGAKDKALHVIEGAGHLFEGPRELEEVAGLAVAWVEERIHEFPQPSSG